MESSNRLLLLTAALGATVMLSGCASMRWPWHKEKVEAPQTEEEAAAEEEAEDADSTPPRVIDPNVARRKIKTPKIDNENWEIGAGLRFYLTRRFFVRADYRWHTVFTSRDDNEELEEWKVLIACFF